MSFFHETYPVRNIYELSDSDKEEAELLAATKYKTWEWNWAYGPEYNLTKMFQVNDEKYLCNIDIKDGVIVKCSIEGSGPLAHAAKKLVGCRHMTNDIMKVLNEDEKIIAKDEVFNFF